MNTITMVYTGPHDEVYVPQSETTAQRNVPVEVEANVAIWLMNQSTWEELYKPFTGPYKLSPIHNKTYERHEIKPCALITNPQTEKES